MKIMRRLLPEMASDEDDLAAILNLPSVKSERMDIMADRCEGADTIIEINMSGDAKNKTKGHETVPIKIDKIVVRRLFDKEGPDQGVDETITVGMTVTCRTYFNTEIEGEILAFDANTKMVIIKSTLALDQLLREGTHMVNLDYIMNISIVKGPHTREKGEDLSMKEELPADNKVVAEYEYKEGPDVLDSINVQDVPNVPLQEELPTDNMVVAKYEYEGEPDEQNSINVTDVPDVPPKEELLADNGLLSKYEYSHSGNVMINKKETAEVAKMLAYMDENYNIPSQMGDEDEPTADLEREEPNVRENPYSINEQGAVANHGQSNGVANKKESRGSP
jgi:hypothetical protein